MVWAGDNYPQEYLTPEDEDGPTDDVLEMNERIEKARQSIHATNDPASAYAVLELIGTIEALMDRVAALEEKINGITVGAGGALYAS